MTVTTVDTNAYWDAVKDHIEPTGSLWGTAEVGADFAFMRGGGRRDYVARYSWTITAPETVAFVAHWSNGRMIDPMAGTGWWAYVLAAHGVDVVCSDIEPGTNHWHNGFDLWAPVAAAPAVEAVASHADRTLFLSWPPYDRPDGADTLRAYDGRRLILIHEGEGGCIGNDDLFAELDRNWTEVAEHVPVQWYGMHDRVTAYDRKES